MGIKDLKPYEFSSTNQPPNESKRVPKYKHWLKKAIEEHKDSLIAEMKKGDVAAWKLAFERSYGKEPDIIRGSLDVKNKTELKIIGIGSTEST